MLQSAASSRTRGKDGQPSAVQDEGKDTRFLPRFGPPEGKDLLLLDCIMEVLQWASSAARRRVAWVYEGTCLYSPYREVYIGSPPLGFTYLNRFGYSFSSRLT